MLEDTKSNLILELLTLLDHLSHSQEIEPLATRILEHNSSDKETARLNSIYNFSAKHFKRKITIEEIAEVANLSSNSFCRYFKSKTGKTYTNFLHEIRIKHACKLLIESKLSISQIINECGFVNYANFFRYFKMLTGKTPAEYQKLNNDSLITEK
jgi:AraC-like DNA-binding protein